MMYAPALSDEELLRTFDDVFREHPATKELAERFGRVIDCDVDPFDCDECERKDDELEEFREALSALLNERSHETEEAARKLLGLEH